MSESKHPFTVGLTARRDVPTAAQLHQVLNVLDTWESFREGGRLVHGGCLGGDAAIHDYVFLRNPHTLIDVWPGHLPQWRAPLKGCECRSYDKMLNSTSARVRVQLPQHTLKRNRIIVDRADVLVAIVSGPERVRSGTWSTVRYARESRAPHILFYPDGSIERVTYTNGRAHITRETYTHV